MIILKLQCGLGNQMFQYAFARSLAAENNSKVYLDLSECPKETSQKQGEATKHPYELDVFSFSAETADITSLGLKIREIKKHKKFKRKIKSFFYGKSKHSILELREYRDVGYDKSLLKLPDNTIINGYFQSYRYFDHIRDIIRDDFKFKDSPDEQNRALLQELAEVNSVAIHIRRGDYIHHELAKQNLGTCSLAYYMTAVEEVAKRVENPHFYIFSNDPDWVKENLCLSYPMTIVTHNVGAKNWEDMRLMSRSKHNIIANSTFSWWAAWLNENDDKVVVCPTPFFNKPYISNEDIYPCEWIKVARD